MTEQAGNENRRFGDAKIGVVCGGRSREREVSLKTGNALAGALEKKDYRVQLYTLPEDLEDLVSSPPEAVVIAMHGELDEGGATQGLFETMGIPYTGSGILASALAMDKRKAKQLFRREGDLSPPESIAFDGEDVGAEARTLESKISASSVEFPVVLKPNSLGSSVGVHICENTGELIRRARNLASSVAQGQTQFLIEEYIAGHDYTVGIFDDQVLGTIRVVPAEGFYDFEAKYEATTTRYENIDASPLREEVERQARVAYQLLDCRGVARVDFRIDDRESIENPEPRILEVNTIPGMTETSLVPKLAARCGMDFSQFTEAMLQEAECGHV